MATDETQSTNEPAVVAEPAEAPEKWMLRLYIAGDSPKSRNALTNLKKLCEAHLQGQYEIEVIDLIQNPKLAKDHQIFAIPTLIRKLPEPLRRVIGDLSDPDKALLSLDMSKLSKG